MFNRLTTVCSWKSRDPLFNGYIIVPFSLPPSPRLSPSLPSSLSLLPLGSLSLPLSHFLHVSLSSSLPTLSLSASSLSLSPFPSPSLSHSPSPSPSPSRTLLEILR